MTESTSEADPLIGTIIAERYRIDAQLGEGGMGAVYRGEHVHMRKVLAIKVLHREMMEMEEAVKRFEREAVAAARIEHPNVAGATDFGRLADGSFYLVLEYVAGVSLVDTLKQTSVVPTERAVSIAKQIAAALNAAHAQGIVHRDLKPDNVMLLKQPDGTDLVKVLDFGIAKVKTNDGTQLTQLGRVFGTPQYMAPEQAAGTEVDHRVDLYALGLILHEMLRGRPTFESTQVIALLTMQMTEAPPELPQSVPAPIRELTFQLLNKAASDRPSSAKEVMERLDAATSAQNGATVPASSALPSTPLAQASAQLAARAAQASVAAAETGWRRAAPVMRRALLASHRTRIKGVPSWVLAAGVLALVVLIVALFGGEAKVEQLPKRAAKEKEEPSLWEKVTSSDDSPASKPKKQSAGAIVDPDLKRMVALAKRGSEPAVFALEQRDEEERSAEEWSALAIGRLRLRRVKEGLAAAERAIDMDPEVAGNPTLLGGLRYFGARDESSEPVLEFVAAHLGSHGADMLFHVWSSTSRKTLATERAKELLDSSDVQKNMSEALRLALELREAKTCEDRRKLMPRLEKYGDERSMIPMREMAKTRGCGRSKKEDCYPCLREDSQFKDALTQVAMRNAPRYEWRR